nr:sigma-54-dependent Fis family transcriptional regulator [candidate division Zixibacteria bacterium]
MKVKILIVDDNEEGLKWLKEYFCDEYHVLIARSGDEAIEIAKENLDIAVVIMDIKMPGMDGLEAGRHIREILPKTRLILHTGFPGEYDEDEIDRKEKPFDYIQKGRSATELKRSVKNASESFQSDNNKINLLLQAESSFKIVGRSNVMMAVFEFINKFGPTNNNVLITGESGTGKELVAQAIHNLSNRGKLVIYQCSSKDRAQVESELFGHNRDAFSNAGERTGYFEYADGGTLFLDEIGDLDLTTQAKILRVVEYKTYIKIGAPMERKADIRIICATNNNLEKMVEEKSFRFDLYQRLNGLSVNFASFKK